MPTKICADAVRWALKHLSFNAFLSLVNSCSTIRNAINRGGFKLQPNSFRDNSTVQRLLQITCNEPLFAQQVLLASVSNSNKLPKLVEAYGMLSPNWLRTAWRPWFRCLDDPRPIAAMFFTSTAYPKLKRIGELLAGRPNFWREPKEPRLKYAKMDPEIAKIFQQMLDFFRLTPFANAGAGAAAPVTVTPVASALLPLKPAAPAPSESKRIGEISEERDKLRRELRIMQSRHNEELAAKQKELEELNDELDELRADFQTALEELKTHEEASVEERVRNFEAISLGIHPDLAAFAKNLPKNNAPLRERVKAALHRQRELNRKYSTNQQLRDELEALVGMQKQISTAAEDAIMLNPDIPQLQKDLEAQIEEITTKLRLGHSEAFNHGDNIPTRLQNYLKGMAFEEDAFRKFSGVEQLIQSELGHQLLQPTELRAITELLKRRRELCRTAIENQKKFQSVRVSEPITGQLQIISQLSIFIDQFKEVELYVDAYNVLLTTPYWKSIIETPNGFSIARNQFIERCAKIAKCFKHVTLVFDSDLVSGNIDKRENLTIVFVTKTTEDQNADNFIVERLNSLAQQDEAEKVSNKRWLISDDMLLRVRVQDYCAAAVSVQAFAALLQP